MRVVETVAARSLVSRSKMEGCYFPDEIFFEILVFVPAKDLIRFKIVCKSWYLIISDPEFVNTHLARARVCAEQRIVFTDFALRNYSDLLSLNLPNLSVQSEQPLAYLEKNPDIERSVWLCASCNGLLLLRDPLAIYNPVTHQFKRLHYPPSYCSHVTLVHDISINEYKVFGIPNFGRSYFVLTNTSGEWRDLGSTEDTHTPLSPFLFLKNELHWVIDNTDNDDGEEKAYYIVSFDITKETFRKTRIPIREHSVEQEKKFYLSELRESLCLTIVWCHLIEIQVLDDESNFQWNTSEIISFQALPKIPTFFKSFLSTVMGGNTCIVCVSSSSSNISDLPNLVKVFIHLGRHLFLYDLANNDLKDIAYAHKDQVVNRSHVFHFDSLVSWK